MFVWVENVEWGPCSPCSLTVSHIIDPLMLLHRQEEGKKAQLSPSQKTKSIEPKMCTSVEAILQLQLAMLAMIEANKNLIEIHESLCR